MGYRSGKIFTHSQGLSCAFRQWRAKNSHCRFLHGYALQVELEFERFDSDLDERNWVMGFGDLKPVKKWLEDTFDHKTLVAKDDPAADLFRKLDKAEMIDLLFVDHVGIEAFAKKTYDYIEMWLKDTEQKVNLKNVTIREHEGNWASYSGFTNP